MKTNLRVVHVRLQSHLIYFIKCRSLISIVGNQQQNFGFEPCYRVEYYTQKHVKVYIHVYAFLLQIITKNLYDISDLAQLNPLNPQCDMNYSIIFTEISFYPETSNLTASYHLVSSPGRDSNHVFWPRKNPKSVPV